MRWNLPGGGKWFLRILTVIVVWAAAAVLQAVDAGESAEQAEARRVLDAAGVRGGLVVHLGSGDGKLTAALRAGTAISSRAWKPMPGRSPRPDTTFRPSGSTARCRSSSSDGKRLPYVDNLVNADCRRRPCLGVHG